VVAKVLKETTVFEDGLNLGNTSSESEEDTYETYELKENFGFDEILPEGESPRQKRYPAEPNPRMTLVFMAYEKKAGKKEEHLINVSSLAYKFA